MGFNPAQNQGQVRREKYIIAPKKTKKNFASCSHRGAESIHQRHSLRVRRALQEPRCSIWEQPAGPLPPPPCRYPNSVGPSVWCKRGEKGEGCDAQVLKNGKSKVKKKDQVVPACACVPSAAGRALQCQVPELRRTGERERCVKSATKTGYTQKEPSK